MRALLANKFFFRNGGSESVLFQEREFLRETGFDVVDFAMEDPRNLPSDYSSYFVSRQSYGRQGRNPLAKALSALKLVHSPEATRKIGRLIEHTRPDLLHCHNIYHQLTPSIIRAAKLRGVPVVLTLHDYKPVCPVYTRLREGQACSKCLNSGFSNVVRHRCADGSLGKSALLLAEAWGQRLLRSYEMVDAFVAPSAFMRDSVSPQRFSRDRVEVIYNGIDCERIAVAEDDAGYALYLGRLSSEKGVETLLAAHASVAARVPLSIAGTGPLERQLRERFPTARFLGHRTGTELESVIRRASFIVVPSQWYENCPMSVLEAMAWGKPVVGSDIGGIPELVMHEETGLLFPPGDRDRLRDCLTRLMEDPALRRRYGRQARARAERCFSLKRHNDALLRLYRDVVDKARAGTPADHPPPHTTPTQRSDRSWT